ncbi:hypothetical protein BGZ76_003514, partial [Entomortierella beljakovae]
IHGARGLYELVITNDEKVIANVLSHGGLDAVIYLCSMVHGFELHSLATTALAALAEHKSVQSMIVAKRAMPKLFHIVSMYTNNNTSPVRPPSPPVLLTRKESNLSIHTKSIRRIENVALVLMNVTHIVFRMVPDKLLAKQIVQEGAMDSLMSLCVYFPAGARTRATEEAIKSISHGRRESEDSGIESSATKSIKSSNDSRSQSSLSGQSERGSMEEQGEENEAILVSIDEELHLRIENMQSIAAKCISILASDVTNQAFIVDDSERINRLVQLLYSTNLDVVKYASKTMAYLSLRNDKYKPDIVKGSGASALLAVIRNAIGQQVSSGNTVFAEAVSHACCALANLATNTESQEILMSHLDLLNSTCSVVGLFPHQRDIERHVARLIANLALYDQNKLALLTAYNATSDNNGIYERSVSPNVSHRSHLSSGFTRFASPPPNAARRAKSNVVPTLLHIGSLTLENVNLAHYQQDEEVNLPQGQDMIDFMNDDDHVLNRSNNNNNNNNNNNSRSLSPVGSQNTEEETTTSSAKKDIVSEWTTVPGMDDVQRHIIRAIDNLMTSVTEDLTSHQSFKVFSRIWPTAGLIKTIQLVSQDEDTQRRATHVLSTLIHLQEIHADALKALQQKENPIQLDHQAAAAEQLELERKKEIEELEEKEKLKRAKADKKEKKRLEREELEKKNIERERIENDRLEQERAQKEKLEQELRENERLEQERLENERLEQERAEKERLEQENAEKLRSEKARAKKERAENERIEKERLEQERLEQVRIEKELREKERKEKKRLEKERLEQERIEKERLEQERIEKERLEQERIEKERLEQERIEKERLEQELAEKERIENEKLEQERIEKETLEKEHAEKRRQIQKRIDEDRAERARLESERLEKKSLESKATKEKKEHLEIDSDEGPLDTPPKAVSSSEDQQTSHDDEPKPKEKSKKKKKKSSK